MTFVSIEALTLFALLGLIVGSFLNVLILRLPLMILETDEATVSPLRLRRPDVRVAPIAAKHCVEV
jgi:prepilin signal peptidase PulO-like enzyme (type II secretory pathway)